MKRKNEIKNRTPGSTGLLFTFLPLFFFLPWILLGQSTEEDKIRNLFKEKFVTYWQAGDAEALASLWHEEGDWMSIVGSRRIRKGPNQIEQVWSVGLQGRDTPEERALDIKVDAITMRGAGAQVDLVMTFGTKRTGIVREAMVALLKKQDNKWKIISSRVARISSTWNNQ